MAGRLERIGPRRRRRERSDVALPRVPRLQGRMSGWRRRGAIQERIPRRLLETARHATPRARCSDTFTTLSNGAAGSRRCRTRSHGVRRFGGSTNSCSDSIARRRPPAWASTTFRERFAQRSDRIMIQTPRRTAHISFQRHVYQLLQSRHRDGGSRRSSRNRAARGAGAKRLLWASAHLAGTAGRGARTCRPQYRGALSISRPRRSHRVLRTELPVRGSGRRSVAASR